MAALWMEVFRTGTHTSGNGITKTYTEADLVSIADTYNSQKGHEAPLVIGHPDTDSPAFGWTKQLKVAGGKLLAFVDQITDSVIDAIKAGHYKKISIALYGDNLLRHIGLLGATPPAVKGLAPVQFSEAEFDEFAWATDEWRVPIIGRVLNGIRDFFIEKFGLEVTNKIMNSEDISRLQESAGGVWIKQETTDAIGFSDKSDKEDVMNEEMTKKIKEMEDKLAEQSAQFSELSGKFDAVVAESKKLADLITGQMESVQAKVREAAFESDKAGFKAFCDGLAKEGKILPAETDALTEEYASLRQAEESLTFAEDQARPSEKMKERLGKREAMFVSGGQAFASARRAADTSSIKVPDKFANVKNVDPMSVEIDKQIREYAEQHKVSYEIAAAEYSKA